MNYDELPLIDEDTTHGMGGDVELAAMGGGREQRGIGTGIETTSSTSNGNGGGAGGAGGGNQGGMLSVSVREMQALVLPSYSIRLISQPTPSSILHPTPTNSMLTYPK